MNEQLTFDPGVTSAADLLVEEEGSIEAAIEALNARREPGEDASRENEAIAYLRRKQGGEE